ncbi:hypothetical protein PIB30_075143 [Stylosanthes scabra]|uniref:Ubiquitin-like protease family profile domain-containing protein n=1 Tax=Stylosanthes scabra TaxID=79078 RepID=A0ABU6WPQ7_9FABA|nr:hypothetical protein [Stylosanthes scabra]
MKVLIPKTEEVHFPTNEGEPPNVVCQPSQSIVEVIPIYPSQEVIDISSSSEDEQPPLIPKEEKANEHDVSSPSSRIKTDVLMSMNLDRARDDIPSFDLGVGEPLLTKQVIEDITEMDDQLKNNPGLLKTPEPTKSVSDIQIISLMCHVLNKQADEQFEKLIYCVPPEILQRMFEKYEHEWMDNEKRAHDIMALLFGPVLYFDHWWLYVLDVDQRNIVVIDSKNIKSPTPERTEMNKFASNILDQMLTWAGNPSIFNRGKTHWNQSYYEGTRVHNIQRWSEIELEEFRRKIVAKILLS